MSAFPSRNPEIASYLAAMQPLIDLWALVTQHAVHEITQMPSQRMMGAHVEHLQALYRGAVAIQVPASCRTAHHAFLATLRLTIASYLATAEQQGDDQAHSTLLGAMDAYATWRSEVAQLQTFFLYA